MTLTKPRLPVSFVGGLSLLAAVALAAFPACTRHSAAWNDQNTPSHGCGGIGHNAAGSASANPTVSPDSPAQESPRVPIEHAGH